MRRSIGALTLTFLFVLALVWTAKAQEPSPPGPRPNPIQILTRFLQLTQDQLQQFETLLRQRQETVQSLGEQIRTRSQRLDSLLNSSNPDPGAVGALVVEIHRLTQQIRQAQEGFMTAFRGLLTQEQQDRLAAVQRASRLVPVIEAFARLGLLPPPPEARPQQFSLPLDIPSELFGGVEE